MGELSRGRLRYGGMLPLKACPPFVRTYVVVTNTIRAMFHGTPWEVLRLTTNAAPHPRRDMAAMDDAFYNLVDDSTASTRSSHAAAPPARVMMPVNRVFPVFVPINAAAGQILNITCPSGCQIQVPTLSGAYPTTTTRAPPHQRHDNERGGLTRVPHAMPCHATPDPGTIWHGPWLDVHRDGPGRSAGRESTRCELRGTDRAALA